MLGFVRQQQAILGHGLPLRATVLVLESDGTRVVLAGVDTLGITSPDVDVLRERVAGVAAAEPAGVLLNWNHTHRAPPPSQTMLARSGLLETDGDERIDAYRDDLFARVLQAVDQAVKRLEPAALAWGVGEVDVSVNRRERAPDGRIVHGWRADGLVDRQVVALQALRRDDSAIATVVGYGCHPVSVGMDFARYSGDYPAAMRAALRRLTGGESVFLQGAAGNVLPRVSFCRDEDEAVRMGDRIALEAVHALADHARWPSRIVQEMDGSLIPMILFRFERTNSPPPVLRAVEERIAFPLAPLPTLEEIRALRDEQELALAQAVGRGAGPAERYGLAYHAKWARRAAEDIAAGIAPTSAAGSLHAVRIGDGVIVTAPAEVFTEIGIAVKERSPGRPTLYAGYTNGAIGYVATAQAHREGGYEPAYSNRSYGLPAPLAPACERILVERGVRLAESLFPERPGFIGDNWEASGELPAFERPRLERPEPIALATPPTAPSPG